MSKTKTERKTTHKSAQLIDAQMTALRKLIDKTDDPIELRIAYAMETAVRWSLERTVGWPNLVQQAKDEAFLLKKELSP